jgi:hypothetical protein
VVKNKLLISRLQYLCCEGRKIHQRAAPTFLSTLIGGGWGSASVILHQSHKVRRQRWLLLADRLDASFPIVGSHKSTNRTPIVDTVFVDKTKSLGIIRSHTSVWILWKL